MALVFTLHCVQGIRKNKTIEKGERGPISKSRVKVLPNRVMLTAISQVNCQTSIQANNQTQQTQQTIKQIKVTELFTNGK